MLAPCSIAELWLPFDKSMGGIGSGRWGVHARHATVDEAAFVLRARDARIAVCRLAKQPHDTPGRSDRARTVQVTIQSLDSDRWQLIVSRPLVGEDRVVLERRQFRHTAVWVVRCPSCEAARRALYAAHRGGWLQCRVCAGLRYATQRLAPMDRARYLADRAARRLGVEWSPGGQLHVRRRRGARRRTFRARQRFLNAQAEKWDRLWWAASIKLLRRAYGRRL